MRNDEIVEYLDEHTARECMRDRGQLVAIIQSLIENFIEKYPEFERLVLSGKACNDNWQPTVKHPQQSYVAVHLHIDKRKLEESDLSS